MKSIAFIITKYALHPATAYTNICFCFKKNKQTYICKQSYAAIGPVKMKHMRTIYCERTNEQKKHQNQNKQLHQFKSNLTVTDTNMVQKCVWHHTKELTQTQSMQTHKINVKNHLFNFNGLAFVCIFESTVIFHNTVQFGNLRTVKIHKQQNLLETMS